MMLLVNARGWKMICFHRCRQTHEIDRRYRTKDRLCNTVLHYVAWLNWKYHDCYQLRLNSPSPHLGRCSVTYPIKSKRKLKQFSHVLRPCLLFAITAMLRKTFSNYKGRNKQIIQCPSRPASISEGGSGRHINRPQSPGHDMTPLYHSQQYWLLWVFAFTEGFNLQLFRPVTWGYSLKMARLFQSLKHPSDKQSGGNFTRATGF